MERRDLQTIDAAQQGARDLDRQCHRGRALVGGAAQRVDDAIRQADTDHFAGEELGMAHALERRHPGENRQPGAA